MDEVLCYGSKAIASSSAKDQNDICLAGESFEHCHLDYRYERVQARSVSNHYFFYSPTVGALQKYASLVESCKDNCADYNEYKNLMAAAAGVCGLNSVEIPFNRSFVTQTDFCDNDDFFFVPKERILSDKGVSGPGMVPLGSYLKILSMTKDMKAGRLPSRMESKPAYKNCRLCPHKGGLIVGERCMAHGQVWDEFTDTNRGSFPLTIFLDGLSRFIIVHHEDSMNYDPYSTEVHKHGSMSRVERTMYNSLISESFKPMHVNLNGLLSTGTIDLIDVTGHSISRAAYIFNSTGSLMNFSDLGGYYKLSEEGETLKIHFGLDKGPCDGKDNGTISLTFHQMVSK